MVPEKGERREPAPGGGTLVVGMTYWQRTPEKGGPHLGLTLNPIGRDLEVSSLRKARPATKECHYDLRDIGQILGPTKSARDHNREDDQVEPMDCSFGITSKEDSWEHHVVTALVGG